MTGREICAALIAAIALGSPAPAESGGNGGLRLFTRVLSRRHEARFRRRTVGEPSVRHRAAGAGAGIAAVIQPGGSVRDAQVVEAIDAAGAAMVFTSRRHFRH